MNQNAAITVMFTPNDKGNPPLKLADAEVRFHEGPMCGLKLVGFAVWERKNKDRNVTFPARQFSVNGERRSFALLRPAGDNTPDQVKTLVAIILQAYADMEQGMAVTV